MADVLKDVNKEAYRSELQKESSIYCREKYGAHGIDITPDLFWRNKRRVARHVRKFGLRNAKSKTKSATVKQGGASLKNRKRNGKVTKKKKKVRKNT
jgi:hypothetical protein